MQRSLTQKVHPIRQPIRELRVREALTPHSLCPQHIPGLKWRNAEAACTYPGFRRKCFFLHHPHKRALPHSTQEHWRKRPEQGASYYSLDSEFPSLSLQTGVGVGGSNCFCYSLGLSWKEADSAALGEAKLEFHCSFIRSFTHKIFTELLLDSRQSL